MTQNNTDCCIVGAGPAGVMLAYLLARKGVDVTLLEAHQDFSRDFRGDSLIPGVMEVLDELGLADKLLELDHSKIDTQPIQADDGFVPMADYTKLKTKFPYLMVIPQARFLEFLVDEAKAYPNFKVLMKANVRELIRENGKVVGVEYQSNEQTRHIKAKLTIGSDGRFSHIRKKGNFDLVRISNLMDVIWFRLPKKPNDSQNLNLSIRVAHGFYIGCWERSDSWQCNLNFAKGLFSQIREDGIEKFKELIVKLVPEFEDRIDHLNDFKQVFFLNVQTGYVKRWYQDGLLLIGDAAHIMSSVGGMGINCAIQDAVTAANILAPKFLDKSLSIKDLQKVQNKQKIPVRLTQFLQGMVEKKIIARALNAKKQFKLPFYFKTSLIQNLATRVAGRGVCPVHVKH